MMALDQDLDALFKWLHLANAAACIFGAQA